MKNSKIINKVYGHVKRRMPFIATLKGLYNYSKWLEKYKSEIRSVELSRSFYDELCKKVYALSINEEQSPKPIIIMTTYNDHDIIESIITENHKSGYEQIIIDNWSTDGTWSIVSELNDKFDSVLRIVRYPFEGPTDDYQWKAMLDLKSEIALEFKGRWIIHQDSDEFTLSPLKNHAIPTIFKAIEELGYNAISVRMLDFTPTDDSFSIGNPIKHFEYYRISEIPSYALQNKIWLQGNEPVDLSHMGGHDVKFVNRRMFPIRLPRCHYSIRSIAHAQSKYSPKRLERSSAERTKLGWHTHIEVKLKEKVIYDKNDLIKFDFDELYTSKFELFVNHD